MSDDKKLEVISYIYNRCYAGQKPVIERLNKIAYLCDWYSSLYRGLPITDIDWKVEITGIECYYKPQIISSKKFNNLSVEDLDLIDSIIKKFNLKDADIGRLKPLINSTYPAFVQQPIGSSLNLPQIADMYRQIEHEKRWNDKTITDQDLNSIDIIDK